MLIALLIRAIQAKSYVESFNHACEIQQKMQGRAVAGCGKLKVPHAQGNYYLFATNPDGGRISIPFRWDQSRSPSLVDGIKTIRRRIGIYDG